MTKIFRNGLTIFDHEGIRPAVSAGDTLTVFWAKGDTRTTSLSIEWDEANKSRWIATVPLTTAWKRYALTPIDFLSWENPAKIARRGFDPSNAARITAGLNQIHSQVPPGSHEFWVAQIGTTSDPSRGSLSAGLPQIDSVSPEYKVYPITTACRLVERTASGASAQIEEAGLGAGQLSSPYPRPSGLGFGKLRGWRFQPVINAVDSQSGQFRGSPAAWWSAARSLSLSQPPRGSRLRSIARRFAGR